jgi:hypothetical protein
MSRSRAALLSCLALAACGRAAPVDGPVEAPPPAPSATAEAVPAPVLVDLLYRTRARVAVSSTVANARDYPEHLIDRHLDTAWNGKTGDLDAVVLFRVPATARVRRVVITVGYDKTTREGDLFFMNHRIQQVAITREGRLVGTFELDPEDRRPQAIEIDEPGGSFELRAAATVPGTKTSWRELAISELTVLGTAPDEDLLPAAMPQVTVGGLGAPPGEVGPFAAVRAAAPFASAAAFCARHKEVAARALDRIRTVDHGDPVAELRAYCGVSDLRVRKPQSLSGPFLKLQLVSLLEGQESVGRLMIQTERGFYPTSIVFAEESPGPGCGLSGGYVIDAATVVTPRPNAPILTLQVTKRSAYLMGSPSSFEGAAAFFIACSLDAAGAPVCREEITASYDGDGTWTRRMQETQVYEVHPSRWDWQREASVDDEGNIRLSPCVGPKVAAKGCDRKYADLLRGF